MWQIFVILLSSTIWSVFNAHTNHTAVNACWTILILLWQHQSQAAYPDQYNTQLSTRLLMIGIGAKWRFIGAQRSGGCHDSSLVMKDFFFFCFNILPGCTHVVERRCFSFLVPSPSNLITGLKGLCCDFLYESLSDLESLECICIMTRGGIYGEIQPEPEENPEGGAQGITERKKN